MPVETAPALKRARSYRWIAIAAGIVLLLIAGALIFALANWPFTRADVAKGLGQVFSSTVDIKEFHSTYFPPGCVAKGIVFRDGRSLGSITKLTIESNWPTMVTMQKRVDTIRAEGLYVRVLPRGQNANGGAQSGGASKNSRLVVGHIVADNSVLEVDRAAAGKPPLRFEFHRLTVNNAGADRAMSYRVTLRNPEPPGDITSTGEVGPLRTSDPAKTPLSGSYTFEHADLGVFHLIGGTLESKGNFKGILERIEMHGAATVPDFEVTKKGHPVALTTKFHAFVNGTNGDVLLKPADSRVDQTAVTAEGGILGRPGQKGKTVSLEISSREGRIQDLMWLLMKADRPPMEGTIGFNGKVVLPPDGAKFLKRLELAGDFTIGDAHFTKPRTRKNIDILSERARGDKDDDDRPEDVISNLKGHVVVRNGVAQFTEVTVRIPGALAQLHGTFNLIDENVDLHGDLAMQADLSQATKGFKSFLLKAVAPFFKDKKRNAGAVVPIRITGTYPHPSYGIDLTGKKSQRVAQRLNGGAR